MEGITKQEHDDLSGDDRKNHEVFDEKGKCFQWQQDGIDRQIALFKGCEEGVLIAAFMGEEKTYFSLSKQAAKNLMYLLIDNYSLYDESSLNDKA